WGRRRRPGRLLAVVSPRFAESQPAPVADLAASVDVVPIAEAELDRIKRAAGMRIGHELHDIASRRLHPASHAGQQWTLLDRCTPCLRATHGVIPQFDTCVVPVAAGLTLGCSFSGMYTELPYLPGAPPAPEAERARAVGLRFLFSRVLAHPQLTVLHSVDSRAIASHPRHPKLRLLTMPIGLAAASPGGAEALGRTLGIDRGRTVCLLFGMLSAHKGVYALLAALRRLPAELGRRIAVVIAGSAAPADEARIRAEIDHLGGGHPVQIVSRFGFVPDAE